MPRHETFVDRSPKRYWPLLVLLPVALLLRLWQVNESLWLDELHTSWVIADGLEHVASRAWLGNQSPLYFYFPWLTTSLLGTSEWTLRLPSIIAGVALIGVAYALALRFTRSVLAASTVAVLASLDRNFLFYATEARVYAMVQLVAAMQLGVFWLLQREATWRRRVAFIALTAVAFYLHFTAILVLAGELVFACLFPNQHGSESESSPQRYSLLAFCSDLALVGLLVLPSAPHLIAIGSRRAEWASFVNDTSVGRLMRWFSLTPYVVVPAAGLAICSFFAPAREQQSKLYKSPLAATIVICWFLAPVVVVWAATALSIAPLSLGRYVVGVALAPMLAAGVILGAVGSLRQRGMLAAITMGVAIYFSGIVQQLQRDGRLVGDRQQDWRAAVAYINSQPQQTWPVYVRSGFIEADRLASDRNGPWREYCLSPVRGIYRLNAPDDFVFPLPNINSGRLSSRDIAAVHQAGGAWIVLNATPVSHRRLAEQVRRAFAETEVPIELQSAGIEGDVAVFRLEVLSSPSE